MDEVDASKLLSELSAPSGSEARSFAIGWVALFLGLGAAISAASDDLDAIAACIVLQHFA
jgi:hypothetical protein